jgi:hypothetical protein
MTIFLPLLQKYKNFFIYFHRKSSLHRFLALIFLFV